LEFLTENKAELCKILIIALVFEKNAIFLPKIAENCEKTQKFVIITSTPVLEHFTNSVLHTFSRFCLVTSTKWDNLEGEQFSLRLLLLLQGNYTRPQFFIRMSQRRKP
jgi:hypothetical protein